MGSDTVTPEQLLEHAGWLRALALSLVGPSAADDVVQETWIAAITHPPAGDRPLRPWLATVLRHFVYRRARGEARLEAREAASAALRTSEVPSTERMLEELETQRSLAELVAALDEPYRSTVLLRYLEDLPAAEIARRLGVPAGTVRWRLKEGLDELRRKLDARHRGDRRAWCAALLPLARRAPGWSVTKGLWMAKGTKLTIAALIGLMLVGAGVVWTRSRTPVAGARGVVQGRHDGHSTTEISGDALEHPAWFGQRGVGSRSIAGRVTEAGRPVPGVLVELSDPRTDAGFIEPRRAMTDEAGRFDFGAQIAERYLVSASAPDRAAARTIVDLRDPLAAPDRVELVLEACQAKIVGTIRDASGGIVVGARVRRAGSDFYGPSVSSDDKGRYEVCTSREPLMLRVEAAAYGALVVRVPAPGAWTPLDIVLTPEVTIAGVVVRADDGQPVPQARLLLAPFEDGLYRTAWMWAVSDERGRFQITGVAAGRHRLSAIAEGLSMADPIEINADAGRSPTDVICRLRPAALLRGLVVEDGRPVAGARVWAGLDGAVRRTDAVYSQADGRFVLERVPDGPLTFYVDRYEVVGPQRRRFDGSSEVRVEVAKKATVEGRVMLDARPSAGAFVRIEGGTRYHETRADAAGRFVLEGLDPGNFTVEAESADGSAAGRSVQLSLRRGEQREGIDIALGLAGVIRGRVVDEKGAPLAGLAVQAHEATTSDRSETTTNLDGGFELSPLAKGHYQLQVRSSVTAPEILAPAKDPFPTVVIEDTRTPTEGVVLAVRADRETIAGRVVDDHGAGVPDARVLATREGDAPSFDAWHDLPMAWTDSDGRFAFRALARGRYALKAHAGSGAEAIVRQVDSGHHQDLLMRLRPAGRVEGELVGFASAVDVVAARADAPASFRAHIEGNRFRIDALGPGTYSIVATSTDGGATERVELGPGAVTAVDLRNRGITRLVGRVVEFRTHAPVPELRCQLAPRVGKTRAPQPYPDEVWTDADGRFEMKAAPVGEGYVYCWGHGTYSDGVVAVDLVRDRPSEIEVGVVKGQGPKALLGAVPDWSQIYSLQFVSVRTGQPAERAGIRPGDVVVSVDGANVSSLGAAAVELLVRDRPAGSTAHLGLLRGAAQVESELVVGRWQ